MRFRPSQVLLVERGVTGKAEVATGARWYHLEPVERIAERSLRPVFRTAECPVGSMTAVLPRTASVCEFANMRRGSAADLRSPECAARHQVRPR